MSNFNKFQKPMSRGRVSAHREKGGSVNAKRTKWGGLETAHVDSWNLLLGDDFRKALLSIEREKDF